jgi:hypothetical protein
LLGESQDIHLVDNLSENNEQDMYFLQQHMLMNEEEGYQGEVLDQEDQIELKMPK